MSIASPPTTATDLAGKRRELVVFHHSNLFYWWPVWLLGFILAGYTWYENDRMAIVPPGTEAVEKQRLQGQEEDRDLLILPKGKHVRTHLNAEGEREINQPYVRMSRHKGLGTLFMAVLLLVIIITNVTMRRPVVGIRHSGAHHADDYFLPRRLVGRYFAKCENPGHSHQRVGIFTHVDRAVRRLGD